MRRRITNYHIGLVIIFLVLLIANIALYAEFVIYYLNKAPLHISFSFFNNIFTMISAIIILGFISTRLSQFRNLGDSSIYEISYLIMLGILSIIVSYFNQSTHTQGIVNPYLDVFKIVSVFLILMLIATKTKYFKNILQHKESMKDLIFAALIFTILGCLANVYVIPVNDAYVNVRDLVVMIGGLFGGPVVGIPAGIIAGGFRFAQGGITALPCSISTALAGIIGSIVYILNGKKFPKGLSAVVLVFLYTGFQMFMIIIMTPKSISINYINDIFPMMLVAAVLGIVLFLMIIKEVKSDNNDISYEELRINEFENTLDEYEDRIDQLEEEIEMLKKDNGWEDEESLDE